MIPLTSIRNPIILLSSIFLLLCLSAETMKLNPIPQKRNTTTTSPLTESTHKKLRRLPHIFNKVLELPFPSDADVVVHETPERLRFVVSTDEVGHGVRTRTIQIYPGVTKVVLHGRNVVELNLDEIQLDLWRFRLPAESKPERASAEYVDGELIVTVPKDVEFDQSNEEERNPPVLRSRVGTPVLVQ